MTITNCPQCGGSHFGSTRCPFTNEALRLAKEATNGWACYAKRKIEHDEIARLHREIDALSDAGASNQQQSVDAIDPQASDHAKPTTRDPQSSSSLGLEEGLRAWVQHKPGCEIPRIGTSDMFKVIRCTCGLDAALLLIRSPHDEEEQTQSRIGQTDVGSGTPPVPHRPQESHA